MTNYIQASILIKESAQSDILIALLSEKGYEGFEETDGALKAFIKEELFVEGELKALVEMFELGYTIAVIHPQNWNAGWESSFEPVVVDDFVAVRAGFHQPNPTVQHEIIITPKMSFGTGHHATTYMMIAAMEGIEFRGKSVLDFGTGTAVLAILAEKVGAAKVLAIDNDNWSIENAKENIAANHCDKIQIQKVEQIPAGQPFDIILANINLNVIVAAMPALASALNQGGMILMSGFLRSNEEEITRSLSHYGLRLLTVIHKGDWLCINAIASGK